MLQPPKPFFVLFSILIPFLLKAQADTTETELEEVIIKAFDQGKKFKEVPAAINYIGRSVLERFSPASIVHAVNTTPGVRMEERSPGSYRFNIRGSSLRSPFGVRNVKVYYNDIPITDPGGHTYLNQLGYYNFNSIEIIKGPGSSLYGAGTGGVLLIESLSGAERANVFTEYATGSFGLHNIYGSITTTGEKSISRAGFQHQQSDGYRDHSELKRQVHSWNGLFRFDSNRILKTTFLYGDLFYQTPGALTSSEYDANPKASRPGNSFFPSAAAANASIKQRMFIAGASYEQEVLPNLKNKSVLYGMSTELRNPTIQNYARSSEPHVGGRTSFQFTQALKNGKVLLDAGGEWQEGFTNVSLFKNKEGNADSLRNTDEINNRQSLIFAQGILELEGWILNAAASLNFLKINFERFAPASSGKQKRKFSNELAPRFAIAKKIDDLTLYASASKGFSPPTTSELLPTGGAVNLDLNAEEGWSYDLGIRGTPLADLFIDVNAFYFSMENTIVQRRTAGGGDFFVNAGKTKQYGIETYISYPVLQTKIQRSLFWTSHTYHHFTYSDFKQLNNDFSGNYLPAVPKHIVSAGFDFLMQNGLLGTISYYYSDKIALNDANTEHADAYHLPGAKIGYQKWMKNRLRIKVFAGVDNILDQTYSLGNDINGFGGRYYNAAAGRNYYAAIVLQLHTKKFQNH